MAIVLPVISPSDVTGEAFTTQKGEYEYHLSINEDLKYDKKTLALKIALIEKELEKREALR